MKVLVMGAGNSGLAMAAHLSSCGEDVVLWNRTEENIKKIIEDPSIISEGVLNGRFIIKKATSDIKEALKDIDVIMVTTPASAHKDISVLLSKHLGSNATVILNPGRTFGAIEFNNAFKSNKVQPSIAEAQTIIYTCRKTSESSVSILSIKKDVLISSIKSTPISDVINTLPKCIKLFFKPARSMVETSIGNVGMILHCVPTILNSGWIENDKNNFKYYYDGITPSIADFLERLDDERISVSESLGYKVESTKEWLKRSYNIEGRNLYECIKNNESYKHIDAPVSLNHRYLFEDIPCGLVPLESIGMLLGFRMKLTTIVINLASELLKYDFRLAGRQAERMGLNKENIFDVF